MKKYILFFVAILLIKVSLFAQPIYNEAGIRLYHTPSQEEIEWAQTNNIKSVTTPTPPPPGALRPIAEYEPAEAVLIRYPFGIPMALIKEMAKDCKVITIVSSANQQNTVLGQYNSNGVNTANCEFLIAQTDSYWTRDYGPWFMASDNNEVAMYDFTYNRPRPQDNLINSALASYLSNDGVQISRYASTIQTAGGNFMNDGTSQAASSVEQFYEDNPGMTIAQWQTHFLEYMGIEQYHFIHDALGDYINHIDCWGKYLAPNKVLIGQVPTSNSQYQFYEAAADYFAAQTSPWGMPFKVYRVYTPGGSATTPYTNSLILNNKVFVPVNSATNANDIAALQTYKNAMPGYEIIGINYHEWQNTDALHCRTHEIADRCMLYIKHQPYFAEIENTGTLTFTTALYSYCDNNIYSDSVIVYLKYADGEYEPYPMSNLGNNTWEVTITNLPNELIEYYIFAADESGRRECHPYIGAPDPHKFQLTGEIVELLPELSLDKTYSSVTLDGITVIKDKITISNLGTADLEFSISEIDFPAKFSVTPTEGIVQPDSSQTLTLTYDFNTIKNEIFTGNFKITSNDPDNTEIEISLCATIIVGITEINQPILHIYPNPAHKILNISYHDEHPTKACFYNLLGSQIKEATLTKGINTIDIQDILAGIYFIRVNGIAFKLVKY